MEQYGKLDFKQRRIGITGGIACGKSAIGNYLSMQKNLIVLDADNFSKYFLKPNNDTYTKIINHFGNKITTDSCPKKEIDTKALREIIFNSKKERVWIESLLHPLIKRKIKVECEKLEHKKILFLLIPLLFEAKFDDLCTEIWLIKCSRDTQKKRLMKRDNLSEKEADRIINMQENSIKKEKMSQVILNTDVPKVEWEKSIDALI